MPRVPNIRPTNIYCMLDVRPKTLVDHPGGKPFYCGKTVYAVSFRFNNHRLATKKYPNRPISGWLAACGEHVLVTTVEIVPLGEDWHAREEFWILSLGTRYPAGANVSKGGTGPAGYARSSETRQKMSAAKTGAKHSVETKNKISLAQKNRKFSAEHRAKLSVAQCGKTRLFSAEHRAKISAAHARRRQERCRSAGAF